MPEPITKGPTWHNALGELVDLDDIDREYALNILCHVLLRLGYRTHVGNLAGTKRSMVNPLVNKLRNVVLHGREPNDRDRQRAEIYNQRCRAAGLPHAAPIREDALGYFTPPTPTD